MNNYNSCEKSLRCSLFEILEGHMCSLFPNLETPKSAESASPPVRLEISAAEIMNELKRVNVDLKTFESAESAESAGPFQTSPDSKRVYI